MLDFINIAERDVGTYLYGRTMYEMMVGWENDPAVAGQSPKSAEFAQIWQAAEKIVFSRSLKSVSTKRTRIERSLDPALVRDDQGRRRVATSTSPALTSAASAWRAGVIDECHVFVAPMLVGSGKRMFPDDLRQPLELLDERRFGNGMVLPSLRRELLRHAPSSDGPPQTEGATSSSVRELRAPNGFARRHTTSA